MSTELKYMPILRLRQWELAVLKNFYFGKQMFPCVEIVREKESNDLPLKKTTQKAKVPAKKTLSFEEYHGPILWKIHSEKVFVDLPTHMKPEKGMYKDVVKFIKTVTTVRKQKTAYLIKLKNYSQKIIPVISTYSQITGEPNSIKLQEADLRVHFNTLAFRTFPLTFENDLKQIESVAQSQDFLIVDLGDYIADPTNDDIIPIVEKLKNFNKCHITIVRSAMDHDLTNVGLEPGVKVFEADNRVLTTYKDLSGNSFGDYAGIKKDKVLEGRGISPGFVIFNPLENEFYGFRGAVDEKGKSKQQLEDFADIIIPSVMACPIIDMMQQSLLPFLGPNNRGWLILEKMYKKIDKGTQSPGKFKFISMEHYLHCIRTKIDAGHFK